ncbi:MAG: EAL domain-containing protein [Candidatus Dormibacteria bacterium]
MVDDAGAGFASLRHILELAPQFIKLDLSITQRIEHDRAAFALAVALTTFAGAIDALIIEATSTSRAARVAIARVSIQHLLHSRWRSGRPRPTTILMW